MQSRLLLTALLCVVACVAPGCEGSDEPQLPHIEDTAYITDAQGRVLILHGVNVMNSSKSDPGRMPSITASDAQRMASDWGFNLVRFLIFWDAAEPEPDSQQLLLRVPVDAVTGGDVAHFVTENAGHPGLGVQVGEDAAGHVHVPAGQRERVHDGVVEGPERELEPRTVAHPRDAAADLGDVRGELGVLHLSVLGDDGWVGCRAELDLLRLAHQGELALAGHGVHGACGDERHACDRGAVDERGRRCHGRRAQSHREEGHGGYDTQRHRECTKQPPCPG